MELVVGRGILQKTYRDLGYDPQESQALYIDHINALLNLWTSESASWPKRGLENATLQPRPEQNPHPPIWIGSGSSESALFAAERGLPLMLPSVLAPVEVFLPLVEQYREHFVPSDMHKAPTDFPDAPITMPNPAPPFGNVTVPGDASGNSLTRTPDFSGSISGLYTLPTDSGIYTASVHFKYNDGFPWEVDNRVRQDSYEILNAELAWLSADEHWRIRVFAKNLLDEEYSRFTISQAFGDDFRAAPPRTWGVAAQYSF